MSWGRIAAVVAGGLVAAGVAYWKRDELAELWDSIVITLKGKKVAVLGERYSGKTTLLEFLTKGELPQEYVQTLLTESVKGKRLAMGDLKLDLKETSDVSGSRDAIEEWRKLHNTSDIVLYLVNAKDMDIQRVKRDLGKIESWRNIQGKKPKFLVIVTHLDLDPVYMETPASRMGEYRDRFVAEKLDPGLVELSERPQIIMGSLQNNDSAAKVVAQFIKLVSA